tara:strand:- start:20955 stop:21167 length:213 start_codon:yes stop_codon:yes gene_type:complete
MNIKDLSTIYILPSLAILSTASLIVIAASLLPIAKLAKMQNECIEKTFRVDGINNAGLPVKVWSCNGGGD